MLCQCEVMLDSSVTDDQVQCVKIEAGRRVCKGGPQCASDFERCTPDQFDGNHIPPGGVCFDKKGTKKCARKQRKGKCITKRRRMAKVCAKTCFNCFGLHNNNNNLQSWASSLNLG